MQHFKRLISFGLVVLLLFVSFGCSKEEPKNPVETKPALEEVKQTEEKPVVETETVEEVVIPTLPENMNPLTGLECDASLVGQRPIGVMFNNIKDALPQIGLSKCDIIYEVLAEGGITRLEGLIFDYASVDNIGSIRSARPYYVNIARAYDAV